MLTEFGKILIFIVGAILFIGISLFAGRIIRPRRPGEEKLTTYECGEDPVGIAWNQFNPRFYIIALIFLLFEVEIVFLFPWATIFADQNMISSTEGLWGWFTFAEMMVFIGILALGLAYVWGKGYLEWIRPSSKKPEFKSRVPKEAYNWLKEL